MIRRVASLFLVINVSFGAVAVTASNLANQSSGVAPQSPAKPLSEVAQQLIVLGEEDQRDRKKAMTAGFDDARLAEADQRRQAAWLEITSGRLLGLSEVGEAAVTAQFLLLQHSGDRILQTEMARQMQELVEK